MDFDDALKVVGEWGKYQMRMYALLSLPVLFKGFQVMLVVFTVFVPQHRCAIPGLDNDTYLLQDEDHRQRVLQAVPSTQLSTGHLSFDPCHLYVDFNGSSSLMDFATSSTYNIHNVSEDRATTTCSRWVYDQSEFTSTLITEFDLVCERKDFRAHSNMMMMAGFLFGSLLGSALCDWLGRKHIYFFCLVLMIVFGVASAFPASPEMLLAFRFLSGLGLMGVMVIGFVLAVEMMGSSVRTKMGVVWQMVWLTGPFVLAALSYIMKDWRQLQLVGSVPPFVFLFYWWMVPESPRWLVSKGRISEAMPTLNKMGKMNGASCPAFLAGRLRETYSLHDQEPAISPLTIFRHPMLLLRFVIVVFNWAVISMTYYGLSLSVSNLSGGVRVNFIVSCCVEFLGYMFATFLLDRFGRKYLHTASMLCAGIACVLTIFTVTYLPDDHQWITTALAMLGKLGVSSSFAIIYLYSAELYPTALRNFAVGSGSLFARMGSMLSPYIADLAIFIEGPLSTAIPLIVFGGLALAAAFCSLLLPETLGRKLPETVSDAIYFGKSVNTSDDAEEE